MTIGKLTKVSQGKIADNQSIERCYKEMVRSYFLTVLNKLVVGAWEAGEEWTTKWSQTCSLSLQCISCCQRQQWATNTEYPNLYTIS